MSESQANSFQNIDLSGQIKKARQNIAAGRPLGRDVEADRLRVKAGKKGVPLPKWKADWAAARANEAGYNAKQTRETNIRKKYITGGPERKAARSETVKKAKAKYQTTPNRAPAGKGQLSRYVTKTSRTLARLAQKGRFIGKLSNLLIVKPPRGFMNRARGGGPQGTES